LSQERGGYLGVHIIGGSGYRGFKNNSPKCSRDIIFTSWAGERPTMSPQGKVL